MKFILVTLAFMSTTWANIDNFQRLQLENDTYKTWTREELEERLGSERELLPYYTCNGRDEFEPFLPSIRINPLGDSLRIKSASSDEVIIYKKGRYYNLSGQELREIGSDSFMNSVAKAFERFEKLPSAHRLLRLLEESYFPLMIRRGGNRFVAYANGMANHGIYMAGAISFFDTLRFTTQSVPFDAIGAGGSVTWNPLDTSQTMEADGKMRKLDPDVTLAHEMYHAFDAIRGVLDQRLVVGDNHESTHVSEYRAVYFENLIRAELGIRYRKYYSAVEGPDLLDDDGKPIFISTSCLLSI